MLLNAFIALIVCSTCFEHFYAHRQELETILVLLPHTVCSALVAGGRLLRAEQKAMRPPATKALHTIRGNNTSIVSSSRWWACKCLKHVEQIIRAKKHSVASSWFSSLSLRCEWCRARHHSHCKHDLHSSSQDHHPSQKLGAENHMLQLNI